MALLSDITRLPGRLKAIVVAGVASLTLAAGIAGYSYYQGHHAAAEQARPQIERAKDEALVSDLTTQGSNQVASRLDFYVHQNLGANAGLTRYNAEALKANDADEALDPARADRLLAAQRGLCNSYPGIVGCEPADHAN